MAPVPNPKHYSAHAAIYATPVNPAINLGGRVPYLVTVPRYQPITTLTCNWDEFMAAFFATFYGHAMLWSVGIRLGDISESNLMWDPEEKKPKLCGFDLSHFCESPRIGVPEKGSDGPMGLSNTGTWIFMADELLTQQAMEGLVKRVYRHEVEAFVTVLVWIACRFKDGELRDDPPLEHWRQRNYFVVKGFRARTFDEIRERKYAQPDTVPKTLWTFIRITLDDMSGHRDGLKDVKRKLSKHEDLPDIYPAPTETLEDFDGLRTLRNKILSWDIFTKSKLPCSELFAKLMERRVLNPGKQ